MPTTAKAPRRRPPAVMAFIVDDHDRQPIRGIMQDAAQEISRQFIALVHNSVGLVALFVRALGCEAVPVLDNHSPALQ